MIVCSCNVLSDHDVRSAVTAATDVPRTAKQVYGCLGCSAECGRCARTITQIMTEALGACAKSCCSGCPHSQQAQTQQTHTQQTHTHQTHTHHTHGEHGHVHQHGHPAHSQRDARQAVAIA